MPSCLRTVLVTRRHPAGALAGAGPVTGAPQVRFILRRARLRWARSRAIRRWLAPRRLAARMRRWSRLALAVARTHAALGLLAPGPPATWTDPGPALSE